jgi:hypothetical protein
MKHALKVAAWVAIIGMLAFIAILISFGGENKISLQKTINNAPSLLPENSQSLNLTEKLTDRLTSDIIEKNPTGPTVDETGATINAPSPEKFAVDTLNEELQNFDPETLIPIIEEKDILVISPTTQENAVAYFNQYFGILRDRLSKIKIDPVNPELSDFIGISRSYKQAMADLAAVQTPDQLVDIQIQSLELIGAQANIFELYSKQAEDPLKALFAAKLQEQISTEASELQQKVLSYSVE